MTKKRSIGRGILNGMAQALNFAGRSVVYTYDSGRLLLGRADEIRLQRALTRYERAKKKLQALEEHIAALKKPKQEKASPQRDTIRTGKLETVIAKAVQSGTFDNSANQAIFEQVASDLLDENLQIRILAVQELGKIGNRAAVPILVEALRLKLPKLSAEIKKTLADLGHDAAPDTIADPVAEAERPDEEPIEVKKTQEDAPERNEPVSEEDETEGEEDVEEDKAEIIFNKSELMKLRKKKLLSLCRDLGIKGDDTMTKSALTGLILEKK